MSRSVCLVTGGAGFIGSAICGQLVSRYGSVVVLDNLHPQIHAGAKWPDTLHEGARFVLGDVTEAETWDRLLPGLRPDIVVHLAAETGTGQSLTESTRHAQVNVAGTTCMLDAFARHGHVPRRILLASSRAVYGEGLWRRPDGSGVYPGQRSRAQLERGQWDFPNLSPAPFKAGLTEPHPTSVYGATKLAQEHVLRAWGLSFGTELVVLRLQNVFGPGQSLINPYTGIVSLFCRLARQGKIIPVYEDGAITRDFVYIKDVVNALDAALELPVVAQGPPAYDIGSGQPRSILYVAEWIAARYKAPAPRINGAFRHGDVRHASSDISCSIDALGWAPRWSLEAGLTELCEWIDARLG